MLVNVIKKFNFLAPDLSVTSFNVGAQDIDESIALHPFNQEYLEILEVKEVPKPSKKVKETYDV